MSAPRETAAEFLDRVDAELAASDARATRLASVLSAAELAWRPSPAAWGIADCLDHLATTDRAYLPAVDRALAGARSAPPDAAVDLGAFGRWFAREMEPPPKRRIRAPKVFLPPPSDPEGALGRYRAALAALRERLRAARGVDLVRTKVPSPVSGLLRFRLASVFANAAAHHRRHLEQAERARRLHEATPR